MPRLVTESQWDQRMTAGGWLSMPRSSPDQREPWFNWPMALGLFINFAILAGIGFLLLHKR